LFQVCPPLGDLALSVMTQHFERRGDLCRRPRLGLPAESLRSAELGFKEQPSQSRLFVED
jgi:hypothetical protein